MKKLLLLFVSFYFLTLATGCFSLSEVSSIEVLNAKTEYLRNEEFDLSSLELQVTKTDGSKINISGTTQGVSISGFQSDQNGTRYLTITYEGVSVTLSYTITSTATTLSSNPADWVFDRRAPKSFSIENNIISLTNDITGPKGSDFNRYQGIKIGYVKKSDNTYTDPVMSEAKTYWYVETTMYFTEELLAAPQMHSSIWLYIEDATGEDGFYPIFGYGTEPKYNINSNTWFGWNGHETVKDYYPIAYNVPEVGQYTLGMEFNNGFLNHYIDGNLVGILPLSFTSSKIMTVFIQNHNFDNEYTIRMSVPTISW